MLSTIPISLLDRKTAALARNTSKAVNGIFTPAADEWETPIPLDGARNLPLFPVGALPQWMAALIWELNRTTQSPVDMAASMAMAAISTAISKKIKVHGYADWYEHLNIWTLCLLEASNAKSPVMKEISEPIRAYERRRQEGEKPRIAQARQQRKIKEDRLQHLSGMAAKAKDNIEAMKLMGDIDSLTAELAEEEPPALYRLLASDITAERCAAINGI